MTDDESLECGRTVESVWDTVDSEPDSHQRDCPYCTEVRERLIHLNELTREAQRADDSLEIEAHTRIRVLDFARTNLRRGADIPIHREPTATVSFSQMLIARTAREAIDSFPGLTARRCAVRNLQTPEQGHQTLALSVGVVITPTTNIRVLDDAVREAVITAVSQKLGARVEEVDFTVEDVHYD
ncbi:Asp23/Gls24 family envelope stress response protein [Rothia uropygialis]|uniref:hypothetical protein n=1 Tax=Kocuria sp. 36 TaxID=1415402 RepID=UPI00101D3483|nr:hypothetical protein [Kocuria sp. 36]